LAFALAFVFLSVIPAGNVLECSHRYILLCMEETHRVVIITGASSGLGAASAKAFARRGDTVVLTARREDRLRALVDEIIADGGRAAFFSGDASEEATAKAVVELAVERFGRVDVLVNNAGQGSYQSLMETTAAQYDVMMAANVRSGFVFARAVVPGMFEQGSGVILFVSSIAGLAGAANESVYCASKFAQVGMAQALDAELRPKGIKVEVICPGGMKTEFAVGHGRTEQTVADSRMMDPSEVAAAVVFACSLPRNVRVPSMIVRHMG
jgi:NADP-dependent 3-hydroxy acid dehydrogenase YdfG